MTTPAEKIDSNFTDGRYALETSPGVLPGSPVWFPFEPNSYSNFGGQYKTKARLPINNGRQRQKAILTDLDASGGVNQDLTQTNFAILAPGFLYAAYRTKLEVGGLWGGVSPAAVASGDKFTFNAGQAGTYAKGTVTEISTNDFLDGDIIVIGSVTYTFHSNISGDTADATHTYILVTGTYATDLANFEHGINDSGGVPGTDYKAFAADPNVTAAIATGVLTATAISGHALVGNALAFTYTPFGTAAVTLSGSGTLSGGVDVYEAGDLILAKQFAVPANNGLALATGTPTNVQLPVSGLTLVNEAASGTGVISRVGYQFGTGDLVIDSDGGTGGLPCLTTSTKDLRELGLVPGEWICIGDDTASNSVVGGGGSAAYSFATAVDNGLARVLDVAQHLITLDKTTNAIVDDSGAAKTVRVFFGRVLHNEVGSLIVEQTYQLERALGAPDLALPAQIQGEYLIGAVPNELTLDVKQGDITKVDFTFLCNDQQTVTGSQGLKTGSRPQVIQSDALNATSDVVRFDMAVITAGNSAPTSLFAFMTDLKVQLKNNVTLNKSVSVLGAFSSTPGIFEVMGDATAYFTSVSAIQNIRANSNVTLDLTFAKNNTGITWDMPLITLNDARADVKLNKAVMLPIKSDAASAARLDLNKNYTLLLVFWDYLPTLAK